MLQQQRAGEKVLFRKRRRESTVLFAQLAVGPVVKLKEILEIGVFQYLFAGTVDMGGLFADGRDIARQDQGAAGTSDTFAQGPLDVS